MFEAHCLLIQLERPVTEICFFSRWRQDLKNYKIHHHGPSQAVLQIHDILMWIRIRIRGSIPLTNGSGFGSGCGSGSFYFHH
jgi:hypothetical protein